MCNVTYFIHIIIQGLCKRPLFEAELSLLAKRVPLNKARELVDNLEMNRHLKEDLSNLETVLSRWEKEINSKGLDTRSYLVHFLRVTGLQDLADK